LTSMFVHQDGWHLGFNLFFLYLVGPFIEDLWGRSYFAAFYFLSGLAGALGQMYFYPDSTVGVIGASGAIAGVMGAFAVRYRKARIRFLYFFGPGFTGLAGTFLAPAWLMLGLWLAREISLGLVVLSGCGWTGVAHWVHIGGFLFGVATAAVIGGLEVEERYLRKKIHSALAIIDNPALEKAHQARERHRHDLAWTVLEEELRHHPGNREAAVLSWDLGVELGKPQRALRPMLRCIQEELREGEEELALVHWDKVRSQLPAARPGL
ncbi:MAG: rhomboid family intramembrane serine protease, partial [Actinomycetia bacterium]|nr:rhomboid family intramembrane serine protease [Actinomycetes bacterium]